MNYIKLNNNEYKIIDNYKEGLNIEELEPAFTSFFDMYDYIVGDYAYSKLRLKGFCKKDNKVFNSINDYENSQKYIKDYCAFECRYFIIEKIGKDETVKSEKNKK